MSGIYEIYEEHNQVPVIKVIGVGGGGGNAIEYMNTNVIAGVDFFVANTDAQALRKSSIANTIQMGVGITKGLGAGANPEVGRQSAMEDKDNIQKALEGADMVFIAAGMGGGTGTGAAPVIAEIAKEMGIVTVAVVTKPFSFEAGKRASYADQGIKELSKYADSVLTIPNDKLSKVLGSNIGFLEAFNAANHVLYSAVQGVSEIITKGGHINLDFADVKTIMSEKGTAMMGAGTASGADRALEATEMAIASPLLEDVDIASARGILVNITVGKDFGMAEYEQVGAVINNTIARSASTVNTATVIMGVVIDEEMTDEMRVTVVATGIGAEQQKPDITLTDSVLESVADIPSIPRSQAAPYRSNVSASANYAVNSDGSLGGSLPITQDAQYLDVPTFLRKQAD